MATRLNQIIAVEKGVKADAERGLTNAYHTIQKTQLLSGISRTYRPVDDEGEKLPPESTRVQVQCEQVLAEVAATLTRLFDVTATKDVANCSATADVVVDGQTILSDIPATYLLFLEKKLVDLRTFVGKLPTLDPAETWTWDEAAEVWRADPVETTRTKKIPRNHVLAEATKEHPAQVQVFTEDVVVGYWKKVAFSGAVPQRRVNELLERVTKLADAVKFAREQANSIEISDQQVGDAVFGYLFA